MQQKQESRVPVCGVNDAGRAGFKKYLRYRYLSSAGAQDSTEVDVIDASRRHSSSSASPPVSPSTCFSSAGSHSAPTTPIQLLLLQRPGPVLQLVCLQQCNALENTPVLLTDNGHTDGGSLFVFPPEQIQKHYQQQQQRSTMDSQYLCSVCGRAFARGDMLSRHSRLHSGRRPYTCQICGLAFSRSDHLTTHHRTHTGVKPYSCPHCSYSACRKDMINRHMKVHADTSASAAPTISSSSGTGTASLSVASS